MMSSVRAAVRALRPHQWAKNLLVFLPIVPAHRVGDVDVWARAVEAYVALSLTASALYVVNDLVDLEADRRHPAKRHRPFASGQLPVAAGPALSLVLLAAGAALSLNAGVLPGVALYAAGSAAYSLGLKRYPLVDVFLLAFLYTIRVFIGGQATGIAVSEWLLAFSVFLFLSMAAMKRAAELLLVGRDPTQSELPGRGYSPSDAAIVGPMGVAASFAAAVVLAMYVQSDVAVRGYPQRPWLWGLVPLVLFSQLRLWLSTTRGYMHNDPVVYALRDKVTWLAALCAILLVLLAARGDAL